MIVRATDGNFGGLWFNPLKEGYRFYLAHAGVADSPGMLTLLGPSLLGMASSFLAGLVALRWLSRWLEQGRWYLFGLYCLFAALIVLAAA